MLPPVCLDTLRSWWWLLAALLHVHRKRIEIGGRSLGLQDLTTSQYEISFSNLPFSKMSHLGGNFFDGITVSIMPSESEGQGRLNTQPEDSSEGASQGNALPCRLQAGPPVCGSASAVATCLHALANGSTFQPPFLLYQGSPALLHLKSYLC